MYSIDIKNYIDPQGVYTTVWNPVYSIPITDPNSAFIDPVVKTEMGKAGSFEFTVLPGHPLYKSWCQMKTLLRVKYGDIILFRGRVLTIDEGLKGARKIHCEGDLAFLLDSQQEMTHEEKREEIDIYAYIKNILNAHNKQMAQLNSFTASDSGDSSYQQIGSIDPNDDTVYYIEDDSDKQFQVGEVPGTKSDDTSGYSDAIYSGQKVRLTKNKKKWGSKNWETSMNALEALQKEYGGYFRIRNRVLSTGKERHYLDWLKNYFRHDTSGGNSGITPTPIQIASNLIDINSTSEVDNIFTIFVPVGSKNGKELYLDGYEYKSGSTWGTKYITVPDLVMLRDQGVITASKLTRDFHSPEDYSGAIGRYGVIYKTQKFDNADTQKKLWDYAIDWMLDNYIGGLQSFSVSALDLYHYNPTIYLDQYLAGDRIQIIYPNPETMTGTGAPANISLWRVILSVEYHLNNPEKNTYSIGIPNTQISKTYGTSSKSKSTSSGKPDPKADVVDDAKADLGEVDETLWSIVFNSYFNHDMYSDLDPEQNKAILKGHYLFLKQAQDNPKGSAGLLLDGLNGNIQFDITNPQDEKKALKRAEMTPGGIKYLRYLTESGETKTITGTNIIGADGKMLASQILLGKDADGNTVGINLNGLKGLMEIFGASSDPDNPLKSISIDGFKQFLKFFSKTDKDPDTGEQQETAQMEIEKGELECGKKEYVLNPDGTPYVGPDGKRLTRFKISLAKPITYIDSEGNVQTTPAGVVGAKDFFLVDVPSFHASFAYIDQAIIPELWTAKAHIDELYSKIIISEEWVQAAKIRATERIYSPLIEIPNGDDEPISLANALSECLITAEKDQSGKETGKIAFDFFKIGGGQLDTKTFNMASTQWYKDTLDAEREAVNVGSAIYSPKNDDEYDTYLAPGQWAKAQGWFLNQNNTTTVTTGDGLEGHKGARLIKAAEVSVGTAIHQYVTGDVANETLNPDQWAIAQGQYTNSAGSTSTINPARLIHARALKLKTGAEFTSNMNGDKSEPIPSGYDGFGAITIKKDPHTFGSKTITENGTYLSASDDPAYSGWSTVTVNVPSTTPTLTTLDITSAESSSYFPATPAVGFSKVTVNIPFVQVTDLGIYEDVSGSAGRTPITEDFTLTAAKTLRARYKYGGNWVNGDSITITPSGGTSHNLTCNVDIGWTGSIAGYEDKGSYTASSLARTYIRVYAKCGSRELKYYYTLN